METGATGNPNELDGAASQVRDHCLGTAVILRKVLEHLSNTQLLELSLVNKQWNFEARSVLRNRDSLTARLANVPCQKLADFASDLRQMQVIPFSGIHIQLSETSRHSCPQSSARRSLDLSCSVILDQLPWKHLRVKIDDDWEKIADCPAVLLLKKIFKNFSGALEELTVALDAGQIQFYQDMLQGRSLPCLKTLKIQPNRLDVRSSLTTFIKALVSRAPSLKEFHIDDQDGFEENVLQGSSAVIVPSFPFNPLYHRVTESLIGYLGPKQLNIFLQPFRVDLIAELLNRFIPMVLEASHRTLEIFRMDFLFAVPLMCYGLCFENVTELEIYVGKNYTPERLEPPILALVKGFDFTAVFPKLSQVTIANAGGDSFTPDDISLFVEQGNARLRNTSPSRALDIKHLQLYQPISCDTVLVFAQMFANVRTLEVNLNMTSYSEFPFTLVWEHLTKVEKLDVEVGDCHPTLITNLESALCGVFPEEVAELRQKRDAYLKSVNVVPVKPSIRCMKGLRTLTLHYNVRNLKYMIYDEHLLISKVPALIGSVRCSVTVYNPWLCD